MVEITMIGTGALAPLPERALSCAYLKCCGRGILFDCGEGTQTAALKAGISLMKTDIIALTHYHGDHVFGLPGLLQTLCSMDRTAPLYITGPEGLEDIMAPVMMLAGRMPYPVRLLKMPADGLRLSELETGWPDGAVLRAFPTVHRVVSCGYVFDLRRAGRFDPEAAHRLNVPQKQWGLLQKGITVEADGKTVAPEMVLGPARRGIRTVFTGDTALCDAVVEASAGADLLICDATYGENDQAEIAVEYGHMNFAHAASAAAKAGVKELWLTHYSKVVEDPRLYRENAAAIFPDAVCAEDGTHTVLRFS